METAFRCAKEAHRFDFSNEYKSLVQEASISIRGTRLDTFVALLFSKSGKGKQHQLLCEQLESHLRDAGYLERSQRLVEALLSPDRVMEYAMTIDVLAFLDWLRRFSDDLSDFPGAAGPNEHYSHSLHGNQSSSFSSIDAIPHDQHHRRKIMAWNCAVQGQKLKKEYLNAVKSLPSLLRSNGLGATIAFLESKKHQHHMRLLEHVSKYLCAIFPELTNNNVSKQLRLRSSSETRNLTTELTSFAVWLRYYAEGMIPEN